MGDASVDNVKYLIMSVLFFEFLNDSTRNVDDLYNNFVVHFAEFYLKKLLFGGFLCFCVVAARSY